MYTLILRYGLIIILISMGCHEYSYAISAENEIISSINTYYSNINDDINYHQDDYLSLKKDVYKFRYGIDVYSKSNNILFSGSDRDDCHIFGILLYAFLGALIGGGIILISGDSDTPWHNYGAIVGAIYWLLLCI